MTAGVLNLRLCDREYDCEHCPIDHALRDVVDPQATHPHLEAPLGTLPAVPAGGFHFSALGFYHPSHLWTQVGAGGSVKVGLDDLARRLLGRVTEVRIPPIGANVEHGRPAWGFEGEAGSIELPAPLSGTVLARNEWLMAHPQVLSTGSLRHSWLVRMRPIRLREGLARLLYGRRARVWWREELARLRDRRLAAPGIAVPTLPDGGEILPEVLADLDRELRRSLVEEHLVRPGHHEKGR
jgi:glycine cleavage system H protein